MNLLQRGIQKLRREFRACSYSLGVESLWMKKPAKQQLIVMYHGVDGSSRTDFNVRFCSADDFRKQIRYFKKRFTIVPVRELFEKKDSSRTRIALTFDDGYRNNFTRALPVLEEEKVPASMYITSIRGKGFDSLWADEVDIYSFYLDRFEWQGRIFKKDPVRKRLYCADEKIFLNPFTGALPWEQKLALLQSLRLQAGFLLSEKPELADYWQLMSEEEIRQTAASSYVTVGSHSCYHNLLDHVSPADATEELRHSKQWLESVTGKTIDELAWPNGSYTRQLVDTAAQLGYRYQLAVDYLYEDDRTDRRLLDRFGIYSDRSCTEQLHQVNLALRETGA